MTADLAHRRPVAACRRGVRQLVEVQGAAVVVGEGRAWRRWEEREREKGGGGEEERQKGEGWQ